LTIQELITKLGFETDEAALKKYQAGLQKAEKVARVATVAILGLGIGEIKSDSDLEESTNKVAVAFKENKDEVMEWSKTTLKSFGLAKSTALEMVALYGDMGTSMGLTTKQSADMGKEIVGRAADMASFKNISIGVANTAMKAIFTGETESLKGLGVVMTQANLQEYAYSQNINKKIRSMTQAEKVQLRYNYVMQSTINANNDFKNTSGGVANQTRLTMETVKELAAQFGTNLLPIAAKVLTSLNSLLGRIAEMDESGQRLVLVVLGIVASIYPLIKAVQFLHKAFMILSGGLLTNPIFLIIAGIILLSVVLYKLYKRSEKFRKAVGKLWQAIKSAASPLFDMFDGASSLSGVFQTILPYIESFLVLLVKIATFVIPLMIKYTVFFIQTLVLMGKTILKVISYAIGLFFSMVDTVQTVGSIISSVFSKVWAGLKAGFSMAIDFIKKIFFTFADYFLTIWGTIIKGVLGAAAKVGSLVGLDVSKINGLIDSVRGMQDNVRGKSFFGDSGGGSSAGVIPPMAMAGMSGSNSNSRTTNINSNVTVGVPPGTSEQQSRFIQEDVRKVIRQENEKTARRTMRGAGKIE
jgi:hypothetical protein